MNISKISHHFQNNQNLEHHRNLVGIFGDFVAIRFHSNLKNHQYQIEIHLDYWVIVHWVIIQDPL